MLKTRELPGPAGHDAHGGVHVADVDEAGERRRKSGPELGGEQELEELSGLIVDLELGPHRFDVGAELGRGHRDVTRTSSTADDSLLGEVAVAFGLCEWAVVALEGSHHGPRDAVVHPPDEVGVQGPVANSVGSRAADALVHAAHAIDQALGRLRVPERRDDHIAMCGAGSAEGLVPIAGQVVHAGHDRGVEDLHHDGGQTPEEGGGDVGVDLPRNAAGADQARVPGRESVDLRFVVRPGHGRVLLDQTMAQASEWDETR